MKLKIEGFFAFLRDVKATRLPNDDRFDNIRSDERQVDKMNSDQMWGLIRVDGFLFRRPKETWTETEISITFDERTQITDRVVPATIVYKVEVYDDYLLKLTKQK